MPTISPGFVIGYFLVAIIFMLGRVNSDQHIRDFIRLLGGNGRPSPRLVFFAILQGIFWPITLALLLLYKLFKNL